MNSSLYLRTSLLILILSIKTWGVIAQTNTYEKDSLSHYAEKQHLPVIRYDFRTQQLILPASLITAGAIGTAIHGMNDFHLFKRKDHERQIRIDDYLEWGMLGWVFVCDLIGKEKHHFADQFFILLLAEGMNAGMVHGLKNSINETRPDGGPRSFPSGHTSNVFLGAHMGYKEFKDTNPWLAYSGYAIGTFVGISRIYNNRHWLADVIAGAGFGILSIELAYLIYFPIRNSIVQKINSRNTRLTLIPTFSNQSAGLHLSLTF